MSAAALPVSALRRFASQEAMLAVAVAPMTQVLTIAVSTDTGSAVIAASPPSLAILRRTRSAVAGSASGSAR